MDVVDTMAAYYAQRAPDYERVYHRAPRQGNLRRFEAAIGRLFAGRDVLEVACGTGWWTPHGAAHAASWLATDLSPETLAVARTKPLPASVRLQVADAYALDALAPATFDAAFVGCWWSHVPLQRLDDWVAALHRRLRSGARVVVIDNRFVEGDSTPITWADAEGNTFQRRTLDDGSEHVVLKNFPRPDEALARLGPRLRAAQWTDGSHYWCLMYELA